MKYYEILYIVNPNLEQARLDEVKKEVAEEVTKLMSAGIINHRIFGKKRLAYMVDKHKYGTYMLLHIETEDSSHLAELNTFLKLHKAIIRHLIVRLEEKPEEDLSPEVDELEDNASEDSQDEVIESGADDSGEADEELENEVETDEEDESVDDTPNDKSTTDDEDDSEKAVS